ncbi:nucleolar and spindle-associated protein 1 isoform X3 [Sphaeramia orbicularis]|uniref:nucleolar and spindle-associated protein 1 isoform X3 n=1 Tax=Sphaeramia orbicularis TaxID=375764 RepID=UPI00117F52EA|nr:nucleolar and spindle-associated protein 1 isoform X3 [Sphaeramia orbicularis]
MDLDSMKYAELRNLAKELGLKANMKADKLREALKKHYEQQNEKKEEEQGHEEDAPPVQENAAQDHTDEHKDASCEEAEVASTAVFVSTRRGKGNATKRKMSVPVTVTESDVQVAPTAAQDDTGVDASTAVSSTKRRRLSPKAAEKTEAELPANAPATCTEKQSEIKVAKGGKIPRYESLHKRNKTTLKPVTPNFKKLHEAHFNKMESIDSYVQRKTKQMETYRNSGKDLKMLSDKTKQQQVEGKTEVVKQSRMSLFSPAPVKKSQAEEKRRQTLLSASKAPPKKPAGKEEVPFRPTILSTRRINVRFSEATKDNEYKTSLLKTPARMSPCVASSTPQNKAGNAVKPNKDRTSTFSTTKTPGPFVFTGNTSTSTTPGTQKKSTFDLKASLSRPLTYKPHKGKLKPFGDAKENAAENKSLISNSHQKNYKQHQVQTREGRRAKQTEDRKQKKASMLGARRGLVMM